MTVALPVHTALVARDALAAQAELMRIRASIDRRWATEVARLEAAHAALTRVIDDALAGPGGSQP